MNTLIEYLKNIKHPIFKLAWTLVGLGCLVISYLCVRSLFFTWIWGGELDFALTGQVGDFIGGVAGTFFALSGTLLIFLSFKEQTKQNKREAFETAFFQMLNLHRANVSEMSYTKFENGELQKSEHRKVFRLIHQEFIECYKEVRKFSNSKDFDYYLTRKHKNKLQNLINQNNIGANVLDMAFIDIAYTIIYYGLGEEGEIIIRDKFKRKYKDTFFYPLLTYIKLKPKKESKKRWQKWEHLNKLEYKVFKKANEEFYDYKKHKNEEKLSDDSSYLVIKKDYYKYYGGHQHRLGHYFRHLFQSFKYVNYHEYLSDKEKYFYAKTLRAQLSTYEQAVIFTNSISNLGWKWEFNPEIELLKSGESAKESKLITKFNVIKNLPGNHFYDITFNKYYPNVKFEREE
ncbi:putative phage abortive infection protein [Flavobacterium reichenbachii]|uniref:Phage abortive infection protein n=1 Tax=Flavobacterium reichenbachii TaxID=362418 RepID=A0A085ZQ59_9FLAO|nr:putative phage abortive infection protein [Flavobacterium reichenbachii]KFF06573.1 hypothetical protein IW19_14110 [Flavobacterium reichenbachii]